MQAGVKTRAEGDLVAPNLYILSAHPNQVGHLERHSSLLDELAQSLHEAANEAGLVLLSPPVIRLVADEQIAPRQFHVKAQISLDTLAETSDLIVEVAANATTTPTNAFLIVDGTRIFQLNQAVVNIGRRPDNQLVIDDPRISRVHAQLRLIKGRYVIFDLDSLGGTFVNDQPVHQSILYPGDVVSLAGVPLVFGQDETRMGSTQKLTIP
jgi:pSer/pThr/pTyr-binding forkhead associated (FHA) protein